MLDEPLNGLDPLVRAETIDLLRLERRKGSVAILVVEHAERIPAEN